VITVSELITLLKDQPQDMIVVTSGYEGGYDDVIVGRELVLLNSNIDNKGEKKSWYYGKHGNYAEGGDSTPTEVVTL